MFEATPLEAMILDDVKTRTGLEFRLLAGIPTRGNKAVADAVSLAMHAGANSVADVSI